MKHKIEVAPNNAIYIDGKRVVGGKPFGLFATKTIVVASDDLAEIAKRCNELLEQEGADDDIDNV